MQNIFQTTAVKQLFSNSGQFIIRWDYSYLLPFLTFSLAFSSRFHHHIFSSFSQPDLKGIPLWSKFIYQQMIWLVLWLVWWTNMVDKKWYKEMEEAFLSPKTNGWSSCFICCRNAWWFAHSKIKIPMEGEWSPPADADWAHEDAVFFRRCRCQEEDQKVRNWVAEIREVAHDAEDVVEGFILKVESRRSGAIQKIFTKLDRKVGLDQGYPNQDLRPHKKFRNLWHSWGEKRWSELEFYI